MTTVANATISTTASAVSQKRKYACVLWNIS